MARPLPQRKPSVLLITAAIAAVSAPLAAPALAQAPAVQAGLEEIVVSARRRDESIKDVPLSIQPIDAETLSRAAMQNLYDVTSRVPGMRLSVANVTDAELFIRGIGSDVQSAAADRAVGIFVDNVYMSRNTGAITDLYDLERVEVLKGPQSLLFGKNIVGGLIHYVTVKPGEEVRARAELTAGDYDQVDFSGAVSGPLAEGVYGGLTGVSRSRSGYAHNTATGNDIEDLDSNTLRGHLRFVPSETLEVLLSADTTRLRAGARWVDVVEAGDSDAVNWLIYDVDAPAELPGWMIPNRNAAFLDDDERKGKHNIDGYQNADLWGTSLRVDWDLADGLRLTSITAYRDADVEIREDGAGLYFDFPLQPGTGIPDISGAVNANPTDPLAYIALVPDDYYDQYKSDDVVQVSQELILAGSAGEAVDWRVGGYYLNEDIHRSEIVNHLFPDFNYFIALGYAGDGSAFGAESGGTSKAFTETDADNYGLYGEVVWNFAEHWSLDAGLRYAKDDKDFGVRRAGYPFDGDFTNGPFSGGDSDSWDELLPSASLSWSPIEEATFYARYAEGYKAGGWNGENAKDADIAAVGFDPELATNYELGGKFEFLDGRARINVALYLTEYEDLQTQQFVADEPGIPPNNLIVNAENGTEAKGVEVDFSWVPVDGFTLFGNYAYSQCEFTGELIIDDSGTDIDGNDCRRTPENAYSIGAQLEGDLGTMGSGYARVDYNWSDEFWFDNENLFLNDDEFTLNASLGLLTPDRRWELSLWGKNLTDELNNASIFGLWNTIYANYTPPRTWGATIRWNMD